MIPPHPAGQLAAQDLVLVPQHQQLSILGQIRPDQHRYQAEHAPHQAVDERQQHSEMVTASPLIPQQNTSSQRQTGFPSGTRSEELERIQAYSFSAATFEIAGRTFVVTSPLRTRLTAQNTVKNLMGT
jgi:hypothetical protein